MKVLEYFTFVAVLLNCSPEACCEVKEVSACHGTQKAECDFFEMSCDPDQRIRLLSQEYGYKDYKCETRKTKCMNNNGCCVYKADDCTETYTRLHTYDLMRACSRKHQCGPLQSPNNILTTCGDNASTYIHLQYDCFRDDTVMNICDDIQGTGTEISIVFDQATNNWTEPTTCVCETMVINGDELELDIIDARMMREHSEIGSGSLCSSAILRGEGRDGRQFVCDGNMSEEANLVNNIVGRINLTDTGQHKIILENLFATGANDSPVMVWLYLRAVSGELRTRCFREAPLPPTSSTQSTVATPPVTSAVTDSQNNTGQSTKIGGDDDNTAVIVGVLIPVIVVAIVAVVLLVLWRRKRRPMKRRTVVQNNYNNSVSSMNSAAVISAEYDEIRDVPDTPRPPLYDPVYELAKETSQEYQNSTSESKKPLGDISKNQPTYQNIKGRKQSTEDKRTKSENRSAKLPFGDFRTKKDQLLSFFRRKQDNLAPPAIEKKPSDASITSYDHLNAYNPEVQLEVTPPPEETANPYAHTNSNTLDKIKCSQKPSETPLSEEIKRSASPQGVKAVEVGDSYIEFQFGTLDEDGPDLFKSKPKVDDVQNTNAKLMKPNRPPPKPSSPKLGKSKVPLTEDVSKAAVTDQQTYDYAEENVRSSVASGSNSTNTKGECTADSKGGVMDYSYADVDSDENQIMDNLAPDQIYEDVDDNAEPNIKKCSSAQDLSRDSLGGYEVPVKSDSTRPTSVPSKIQSKAQQKPKSAMSGLENVVNEVTSPIGLGHVVKELKEIQDLPDLSDPSSLPNELKYANLGLHTPKSKQKLAKKETDTVKDLVTAKQTDSEPTKNKDIRLNSESKENMKAEEPAIRKGVLSLAKKFETQK